MLLRAAPQAHTAHALFGPSFFPRDQTPQEARQLISTEVSVLICALLVLACRLGGESTSPKRSRFWFWVALSVWFWTTTTWAASTKRILNAYEDRSDPSYPLVAFWATFLPQLFSAVALVLVVGAREGWQHVLPSRGQLALWACAGTSYWYGQLFTVESLIHGTPALTFVVKSVEPLTTAVLAIPVLGQSTSLSLLIGICIACAGVAMVVTAPGDHGVASAERVGMEQIAGIGFAALANLGFSSRACVAKLALSKLQVDPFVAFTKITVVGVQVGLLPILVWFASGVFGLRGVHLRATLDLMDSRFEIATWLTMCLSYLLYQACSILILNSIAVESHALLVAMKHVTVVVGASILVHARLTVQAGLGTAVASAGVLLYMCSTHAPDAGGGAAGKADGEETEKGAREWVRCNREPLKENWEEEFEADDEETEKGAQVMHEPTPRVPAMLLGLVAALAAGGTLTPTLTAAVLSA